MTPQEIIEEIKGFPINERVALIEQISQSLLADLKAKENEHLQIEDENRELSIDERIGIVENLYGCLREEGKFIPMIREEEREIILEHLLEKYS